MKNNIDAQQKKLINDLVAHYSTKNELFEGMRRSMLDYFDTSAKLRVLVHSVKSRLKDPEHLRNKLTRKMVTAIEKKRAFGIKKENLFSKINDLVGVRLIHLHTTQIEQIDKELKRIFDENGLILVEPPTARTWDDEMSQYFTGIGINIHNSPNPNMYTSVHYIVKTNNRVPITCEIQVRTLMEEVWGEVDHSLNYPNKTESISCREQIKVLARVTSSCSRLVDSIFITHDLHETAVAKAKFSRKSVKK